MARGPALVHRELIFPIASASAVIGRRDRASGHAPDIDLEVLDTSRMVSRRHAEVRVRGEDVVIADLAATNGVWVNGIRLGPGAERRLTEGDAVTLGDVTLMFLADAGWPAGVEAEWAQGPGRRPTPAEQTMTLGSGILDELAPALSRGDFVLHYQPKVTLATGRIEAVEGLVRWRHPTRGLLHPGEFVQLAEQTALVKVLSDIVLAMGIRQATEWMAGGLDVVVAVNLAVQDLEDVRLPGRVAELLSTARLPAERLQVEITETGVMSRPEQAKRTLTELRRVGVLVAVDDFGIGQSSLSYLKDLPATELKTDQSFCKDLDDNDQIILRSAIALGHAMGMHVTAEGVEDARAVELLRAMGCDAGQGYHLGRPAPPEEMTALLLARERPRP